jgi:hypothetical protein
VRRGWIGAPREEWESIPPAGLQDHIEFIVAQPGEEGPTVRPNADFVLDLDRQPKGLQVAEGQ